MMTKFISFAQGVSGVKVFLVEGLLVFDMKLWRYSSRFLTGVGHENELGFSTAYSQ